MTQSLVTVVIPFPGKLAATVNEVLDDLGDWKQDPFRSLADALGGPEREPFVHFMFMGVVPAPESGERTFLVIELSADGEPAPILYELSRRIFKDLSRVLKAAGLPVRDEDAVYRVLHAGLQASGPDLLCATPGLGFVGTPDLTVARIKGEADLARRIRDLLDATPNGSAMAKLAAVRRAIFEDPAYKWALVTYPMAKVSGPAKPVSAVSLSVALVRDFLWPLGVVPVLGTLASLLARGNPIDVALWHGMIAFLVAGSVVFVGALLTYWRLRRDEKEDVPLDLDPDTADLGQVLRHENRTGYMQNHLFAVSRMKPGLVRRVTLRLALWIIRERGARGSRPGFLDRIGSIHFARWILLPGKDRLLFLSNYDGSWESYLEDFIARLREGLTSVWSNTRHFPKTNYLVQGGAADGTRFKRWARRQQLPTRFWYSAYPDLTTHRIRANAVMRDAFASAANEQEAAEFLQRFGYVGREALETGEIPTLAFGGLSTLACAHCLVLRLPDEAALKAVASIAPELTYGDRGPEGSAAIAGFTASGLAKLGLERASLQSFPIAFLEGMSHPRRAASLGDNPRNWRGWKRDETDAILVLYDADPRGLERRVADKRRELESIGCKVTNEIRTKPMEAKQPAQPRKVYEPFGFRDGVSQPAMRGTLRATREEARHNVVEPGELVLGYRDNLGVVAPVPRHRGRDIGRNGTYLVVRHLEQDTEGFQQYLDETAADLAAKKDVRVPTHDPAKLAHWIAAKMVGRWKDGTSLVRNPDEPGTDRDANASPDNSYLFGREDPEGLRCPFGAHVRRANPRDSFEPGSATQMAITNRHRILRVGRSYERQGELTKPGLLFMCINADIERQFEFLQQTWILGSDFHGLEGEVDPIVGAAGMMIPTANGPLRLPSLKQFVNVLGGAYFFMPSMSTMRAILDSDAVTAPMQRAQAAE